MTQIEFELDELLPETPEEGDQLITRPLKAIRAKCLECVGYLSSEVKNCTMPECNLYQYRMGRNPKQKVAGMTPMKAIRKHCIECFGNVRSEVPKCTSPKCNLFQYRLGHNPKRRGLGGDTKKAREAQKQAL